MSDDTSWDSAAVARLEKIGGRKLVREMLDIVLDFIPKKLEAAREGERAGNLEAIQHAVHPIRSSAAHAGARAVLELATRIEQLAMNKQGEQISVLLRELEAAYDQVRPKIERERDLP